ncbi:MAG: spermidine/putrescine ABC transporter substrate-binding protein [Ruminococcaceae bacterium]|nr:spermidine/putrescine ABC transporter substrate-binding protein [Oscillospiraceae bacterium]
MKKKLLALLCAVLLLLGLSGCGGKESQSKELVLYTWEGMFPQEVLDGFTQKTGVKIVYSNFDYDETMLEKLTQAKGGDYDIVIADDYIIEQAVNAGLVQAIDKSAVDNFGNINPRYQGQFYDPEDKYTVPYGCGIPLIVYDPSAVDFEIKGYNDLWNPALKDSVAITANYRVINGITLLSMGKSMNEEDLDVIAQAGEKLLALAPNIRLIQDDNTQNALLNGEASAAFLYTSQVTQVMAENPDLKVVYPEEGLGYGIMAAFIPVNAPNAKAANEFLRYLLEPEISKACMEYIGYVNTNGAADSIVDPALVAPDSAGSGEFIMNVSEEANDAYNRNWTAFKAACGQ